MSGHTLNSYTCTGSITTVGSVNNVPSAAKIYSGSTDVTSNYSITYKNGTLTVSARPVTYKADNQSKTYDGSALSASNTATISSGSLVSGHTATFTCSGSITNAGLTTKTLSGVTIKSGSTDVTSNYSITKNNGTLKVSNASFKVSAPNQTYTYNGIHHGNIIEVSNLKGGQKATVWYGESSGSCNSNTPITRTNAGVTTVYYQVTAPNHTTQSGSYTITVKQATTAAPILTAGYKETYDGWEICAKAANANGNPPGEIFYYDAEYEDDIHSFNVSAGSTTPVELVEASRQQVGTTTIYVIFVPSDTLNYLESEIVSTTATVANKRTVTITAPTATNLTYNGTARKIFEEGSCTAGGVMYYSRTDKEFSTSTWRPSLSYADASADNARTYTLYYYCYVSDTSNNKGAGINTKKSISATINKATPTLTFTASTSTLTYNGSTQNIGTISYNGDGKIYYVVSKSTSVPTTGWIETSPGATIKSSEATAVTYYVYLKADAGTNYNAVAAKNSGSKAINKATGYLTASVNTPLTYNGGAQTIATISTNSGDYYFGIRLSGSTSAPTWSSVNTALSATNAGTYEVWARCDASINYNNVTPKKVGTVVINQRTVTITAPTAINRTYNGITQKIFEEGSCTPGGVMYYSRTGEDFSTSTSTWRPSLSLADASADNARTYTLYYYCYVSDTSNNKGEGINTIKSVSATIDKKATAAPILTAGYLDTYDKSITVYAKAANASNNPAGTIYYGSSSGATTYSISASTTASYLSNMGQHNVGTTTIYVFFRPSDTTNYYDSPVVSTTAKVENRAPGYLEAAIKSEFTYDGSAHTIATKKESSGSYYFGTSSSTTIAPTSWGLRSRALKCTDAGTYYVWGKCDASTNHNAVDAKYLGTAIIRQRIVTITAPTATNRIYSGSAQTIFDAGSCGDGGVMYYSSTDIPFSTSTWSTTLPYTQKSAIGKYTLYYYCHVSDTSNNTGAGINTIKSVSATIDRVIEDYIYKVTCDTVESVDKWTTTLNLNNLIMPTHWIGQKIYFRVYDKDKVLIPRPKNEPSQYSFTIKQDFTTGNSKDIEIIRGAQASLCGEKYGLVEPRYIKIEQKEGTNLPENYVPFAGRYIDVDYIY